MPDEPEAENPVAERPRTAGTRAWNAARELWASRVQAPVKRILERIWGSRSVRWLVEMAARIGRRADVQFVAHALLVLALVVLLRPYFFQGVATAHYERASILESLWKADIESVVKGAQRNAPAITQILFLLVPTLLFGFAKKWPTWKDFDAGPALRILIMGLLFLLVWTGALGPYNVYLHRGHAGDRLLLLGLTLLSWRTPLAVPLATRWAFVLIHESYVPIPIDDFDHRSLYELLVVFSCFVWLSFLSTMRTKHFFFVAVGSWAAYYFAAGWSKVNYGPRWSWFFDNHLSNLSMNSYIRGWLSFIPENAFLSINHGMRWLDRPLAAFTLVTELGALAAFFLHRRVASVWFLLCFLLNFGIYVTTGICFWKWMIANLLFYAFARGGGAKVVEDACRHWLAIALGAALVFTAKEKIHYFPQVGVAWYDTRLMENYEIYAVGRNSGESYVVDPNDLNPGEIHWVQGRLCYATDERSVTGIYGVTGSLSTLTTLENLEKPEDAKRLLDRGAPCNTPQLRPQRARFDDYMLRFFSNVNRWGRPDWWYLWASPPRHLWVFPKGKRYHYQEPITRVELWREVVVHHGGKLHRLERKLVHTVAIDPVPGGAPR